MKAAGVAYSMKAAGTHQVIEFPYPPYHHELHAYLQSFVRFLQAAIAFFGEGCASEGDVSSALNIAAVS